MMFLNSTVVIFLRPPCFAALYAIHYTTPRHGLGWTRFVLLSSAAVTRPNWSSEDKALYPLVSIPSPVQQAVDSTVNSTVKSGTIPRAVTCSAVACAISSSMYK